MNTSFLKSQKSDLKKSDSAVLLNTLNKNILHLTYQNDRILSLLSQLKQTESAIEYYNKNEEPGEEVENL